MDEFEASLEACIYEQLCNAETYLPHLAAQHPDVELSSIKLLLAQCKSDLQAGGRDKAIAVMQDIEEQCYELGVSANRLLNGEPRKTNEN